MNGWLLEGIVYPTTIYKTCVGLIIEKLLEYSQLEMYSPLLLGYNFFIFSAFNPPYYRTVPIYAGAHDEPTRNLSLFFNFQEDIMLPVTAQY